MTQALAMFATTIRQLLGKRTLALGLLSLLPAVVMSLSGRSLTAREAFERFHEPPMAILFLIVLPVIGLILGASSLGEERRQKTLSFLALRPVRRESIVLAKLAAAWTMSFALVGVGAAGAAAALGVGWGDWEPLLPIVIAMAIGTLVYTSVFMLLGYVTERATLIGFIYLLIWESAITLAVPELAPASLLRIGLSAYAALVPGSGSLLEDPLGTVQPGMGGAVAKVLLIAAVCVAVNAYLLRRRDVV